MNLISKIKQLPVVYKVFLFISGFILVGWIVRNFNYSAYTGISFAKHLVFSLTILCAVCNLIYDAYKKRYLLLLLQIIFLAISFVVYKKIGDNQFLLNIVISIAISRLGYQKSIWIYIITMSLLLFSTLILNLLEISDKYFISYRIDGSIRYSFGFMHPNAIGATLLFLLLTIWAALKNKYSHLVCAILSFACYIFLDKYVSCRTAQLCLILSCFIFLVYFLFDDFAWHNGVLKKIFKLCCVLALPILALGTIFLAYKYNPESPFMQNLDHLFSSRLHLSHNAIVKYGFSLFGKLLTETDLDPTGLGTVSTTGYEVIDSFYIYTVLNWGWFGLAVYCLGYFIVVTKAFTSKHYRVAVAILIFSVYGLMEKVFLYLNYNIFIFLIFAKFEPNKIFNTQPSIIKSIFWWLIMKFKNLGNFVWTKIAPSVLSLCIWIMHNVIMKMCYWFKIIFLHLPEGIRFVCQILAESLVQIKNDDKSEVARFHKKLNIAAVIYVVVVLGVITIFLKDLIDYFKTVCNILDFSDIDLRKFVVFLIIIAIVDIFVFFKTLFFITYYYLKRNKYNLQLLKYTKIVSGVAFAIMLLSFVVGELTINSGKKNRAEDLEIAHHIAEEVTKAYPDTEIFVDKFPVLFKRADIPVQRKIVFFDGINALSVRNIIFSAPEDEHLTLMNTRYKYIKLTDTLSLYARDEAILELLSKLGYNLTNHYTYSKSLKLKRIAKINRLKMVNDHIIMTGPSKSIDEIDKLNLSHGTYNFKTELSFNKINEEQFKNDKIITVKLTSNDGALTLYSQDYYLKDFVQGKLNINFSKKFDNNFHSVNLKVLLNVDSEMFVSKIEYSKVE